MTKATETHSENDILIAFILQQWLRERVSMLRYTYIACLDGQTLQCTKCTNCLGFGFKAIVRQVSNLLKGGQYYLV